MLFRDAALGNDVHLTAPTSADAPFDTAPYHLSGWFFGPTAGFDGTVIAPDIVLTAGHVATGIPIGTTFTSQGVTHNVIEKIPASSGRDMTFCRTDGVYPDWATMWNEESWTRDGNWLFMTGHGLGRGAYEIDVDGFESWLWGAEPTRARRWGATRPWEVSTVGASAVNRFRTTNDPGCFACTQGDSGSGLFIDAGPDNSWLCLGVVVGGSSGSSSSKAIWDSPAAHPDLVALGMNALIPLSDLDQIISLGGRVLPLSIHITNPAEDFVTSGPTMLIQGTTTGNPSEITIQLDY